MNKGEFGGKMQEKVKVQLTKHRISGRVPVHKSAQINHTQCREGQKQKKWLWYMVTRDLHAEISAYLQFQFSSVAQSCLTLCDPMSCSMLGLPVHHQLPEPTKTHVHWVGDAIQLSHSLSSPSPPVLNLSQHQGLFKWVNSSHQVAKVLEFQLQPQHQSFQ